MATDTSTYKLNHTMMRVKDPQRSVEFYKFLGLSLVNKIDMPEWKFCNYFLAYNGPASLQGDRHWTDRNAVLELCHNYGTENDPNYSVVNGNTEPYRGFGHIAISVDNIEAACKRIEDAGYPFQKKLTEGRMRNIAFAKDPDGYWVEIIRRADEDLSTTTDPGSYRLNHTMLRVKDAEASLKFYQESMGMKLVRTIENPDNKFNLYFLGYPASNPEIKENAKNGVAEWEGLLELTWNYGTEKQEGPVYHNGNTEPQGFGHICISVDDLEAACERFENLKVNFKKRLTDGRMHNIAFVLDPDGYWIEVVQNEKIKRTSNCATGLRRTVKIVSARGKNANINMEMTSAIVKVSLRATTELFSARIDQLCQFIQDKGLEPPSMDPEDEAAMNKVLDTLQIPRRLREASKTACEKSPQPLAGDHSSAKNLPANSLKEQTSPTNFVASGASPAQEFIPAEQSLSPEGWDPLGMAQGTSDNQNFAHWGFTLPTAESLDSIYATINDRQRAEPPTMAGTPVNTGLTPDGYRLGMDMVQQPGPLQSELPQDWDNDSNSEEEDEAENDVIEQLSHRIGTLKIAGDGHLRFYGATSNLNLVDVSATQQRQRPDARTVRHDGQDILNHLRVGQPVDQALEDHLVELYFTWQNPSTYVVDKEMYMTARSKWRNELDDTPFYSEVLTNAMCAIGSAFEARYHPTFITFPKSLSEFFADRAKALLEIELDSPCVATVQALVIMSCHEGASSRDARGWLYSGMSMRLAFDLGLHLDMETYVKKGDITQFEADVRRATFWGSYVADHFWGFYLGRPFRMNAGDIGVPKPGSALCAEKEGKWHAYGHQAAHGPLHNGLDNPIELICRQFVVLWEMISPVGHILYGCSNISRHDLQRICYRVTEDLFAWKANLPSNLEINLDNDTSPILPHLMMLHMQYHQIIIFFHRPWLSKSYIQPRSPRQGPGYHHARRMCVESATAIARLLQLYEKHYTFRRMNNQVVAIIFSAALMLLFVTVSTSPMSPPAKPGDSPIYPRSADMVAYLNLCFRALDELGQSFENAKRTRDYLVALQRRWQANMRRSGSATKRQISSTNLPLMGSQRHAGQNFRATVTQGGDGSRKKSRLSGQPAGHGASNQHLRPQQQQQQQRQQQQQQHPQYLEQPSCPMADFQMNNLDWIRNSDIHLLSESHGGNAADGMGQIPSSSMLADMENIDGWWASEDYVGGSMPP
ncbi:Glyoxalase I [Penicillium sp. DV-2018c]|nr:Glyoxalase I [Penicillium sp. DV-2018c]